MTTVWSSTTTGVTLADNAEGYLLPGRYIAPTSGIAIQSATDANNIAVVIDGTVAALDNNAIRLGQDTFGNGSNELIVGETGIVRGESGLCIQMYGSSNYLQNSGQIAGYQVIAVVGDYMRLVNDGSIHGRVQGVTINSNFAVVENSGDMSGRFGLYLNGEQSAFTNTGTVSGQLYGAQIVGLESRVFNTGTITGGNDPAASSPMALILDGEGGTTSLINHGILEAPAIAVSFTGAGSDDTLINTGTIRGDIRTGSGADTVKTQGDGAVLGTVAMGGGKDLAVGGTGDDSINGGDGGDVLRGRNGDDELRGAKGNDLMRGGRGDDDIAGAAGRDTLAGGRDNDTLSGGDGADTFVLMRVNGDDVITDFANGADQVDLQAFGLRPAQFGALVQPALNNAGGGATFLDLAALGGDGSVLIEGLAFAQADASDFIL